MSTYPKQLEERLRADYGTSRISVVVPPHLGQNTSQMANRLPWYLHAFQPELVIVIAGVNNSWSLVESNLPRFLPAHEWRTQLGRFRMWLDDVKVLRLFRLMSAASGEAISRLGRDLEGAPRSADWPPKKSLFGAVDPNGKPFLQLWRYDVGGMIDQAQRSGAAVLLMTYPRYDTPPLSEFYAMARAKRVPLVENHVAFEALVQQGLARKYLFEDLHHPTREGYAIVVDNVMATILTTPDIASRFAATMQATTSPAARQKRP